MNDQSEYVTISKAAEILRICEKTLRRWDENGKYPAERDWRNHRVYHKDTLIQFKEELDKLRKVD